MQRRPASSRIRRLADTVKYHVDSVYRDIFKPTLWFIFYPIIMPWIIASNFIRGMYDITVIGMEASTMYLRIWHKLLKSVEENPMTANSIEKLLLSIVAVLRKISDSLAKQEGTDHPSITNSENAGTSSDDTMVISAENKTVTIERTSPTPEKKPGSSEM